VRPLSEKLWRILRSAAGFTVRGRVRVLGPAAAWYDLTNLLARDFLEGVTVDETLESPAAQATAQVRREVHGLSLAPLMTDSRANNLGGLYSPLLAEGATFRVEVGLSPLGMEPGAGDWLPLFLGRIDDVDAGPDVITFKGRDLYGVLQDVYLESEHTYGSDAGTPLQTVLQAILADAGLGSFGLYTPQDPTLAVGKYKQAVEPVADALSKLAAQRGWEVRQKWRSDISDWAFFLWGPDRTGTTPVWDYGAGTYQELGEVATSLVDIRTAVEVVYSDASDLDSAGVPKRKTVRKEDAAALAKYGALAPDGTRKHRWMRLAEASTSEIRSQSAADRLATIALADLSASDIGASVEVPLHPALELADLVRLSANNVHFSADQVLAVRQVSHTLTSTGGKTRLVLRGKPSLGQNKWLSIEQRPGYAPSSPFTGPAAPSALQVTNSVTGAVLVFTAPDPTTGPEADSFELHVGTSPGFTLSAATLREVSSSTCFDVTGLAAGGTYYARVRSRDKKGNVGPASGEVTLAPRYVTPSDLQPQVVYSSLTPNPSLEAWTLGPGAPPDAWTVASGSWGTDFVRTTTSFSGGFSVSVTSGTPGGRLLGSQFVSVTEGQLYGATLRYYQPTGTVGSTGAQMELRWYSSSFVEIFAARVILEGTSVGSWTVLPAYVTAPTGARYARLLIGRNFPASSNPVYLDLGAVDVYGPLQEPPRPVASFYNSFTSSAADTEGRAEFYRASTNEVQLQGAIVPPPGVASGVVLAFYVSEPPPARRRFRSATTSGSSVTVVVNPDGFVEVVNPTAGDPIHLCQVRYRRS